MWFWLIWKFVTHFQFDQAFANLSENTLSARRHSPYLSCFESRRPKS